jgi:phthalate 4,5-dioxygenase
VAFRDDQGRVGLLGELCPHRRASLVLGRNENGTLECLYHGWKIDCTGRICDTPVEPEDSTFKDRIRATAYQTCEAGGVIWAYLGPVGLEPPKPNFYFTQVPAEHVVIIRTQTQANWAQGVEGVIDSSHTNLLHQNVSRPGADGGERTVMREDGTSRRPSRDTRPKMEVQDTAYGFRYSATRQPLVDPEKQKYVRVSLFVAPMFVLFPPPKGWIWMQAFTPIDDEHTMFWFFQVSEVPLNAEQRRRAFEQAGMQPGIDLDDQLRMHANRENNWQQDRAAMRRGESHTGLVGVNREDVVVQESMGPLLDRSKEHLGVSDSAIIRFRRMMIDAVRNFENGAPPLGINSQLPHSDLRAEERMLPIEADWHVVAPTGAPA